MSLTDDCTWRSSATSTASSTGATWPCRTPSTPCARAQIQVLYATNSASRTPADVAAHLRDLGLSGVGDAPGRHERPGRGRHLAEHLPSAHGCLPSEAKASSRHFVGGAGRRVGARGTRPERVLPSSPAGLRRRRHRRRPGGGGVRSAGRGAVGRHEHGRHAADGPRNLARQRHAGGGRGAGHGAGARRRGQATRRCTCCVPRWLATTRRRSLPWGTGSTPTSRGRSRRGWTPSSSSPAWTRRRLSQQRRPACVPPTCSTCAACTRHTRRCRAATGGGDARATGVASWTRVAGRGEGRRDHRGVACCSCRGARRARRRCPRRAEGRRLVSEVGSRQ